MLVVAIVVYRGNLCKKKAIFGTIFGVIFRASHVSTGHCRGKIAHRCRPRSTLSTFLGRSVASRRVDPHCMTFIYHHLLTNNCEREQGTRHPHLPRLLFHDIPSVAYLGHLSVRHPRITPERWSQPSKG